MPLGIISQEELEKELSNSRSNSTPNKEISALIVPIPEKGRGEGTKNVPDSIRKVIAEEKLEGTPSKVLQEVFGVSPSSVAAYSKGATSTATYDEPKEGLSKFIGTKKEKIFERAQNKLSIALKAMSGEKFEKATLRELTGAAKDMSVVMKNMEPDNSHVNNGVQAQFIIHVPQMKQEKDYDVVQVET